MTVVRLVTTPLAFRDTIGLSHSVSTWFEASPDREPGIRRTIATIFDDLPYIDSAEPGMMSTYLEGIEEPLRRLRVDFGLALFAVTRTRSLRTASGQAAIPWPETSYIVATPSCAFLTTEGLAHLLSGECPDAAAAIVGGQASRAWISLAALEAAYEGSVAWCPRCALTAVEQAPIS